MKSNKTLMLKLLLPSVMMLLLAAACAEDEGPLVHNPIPVPPIDTTGNPDTVVPPTVFPYTISFGNDVKPIFPASCVQGCHNPMHEFLDLRPSVAYDQLLTAGAKAPYVDTLNPDSSRLYLHLAGVYMLMPFGGPKLSQGKIDTVYTWITQGALNN